MDEKSVSFFSSSDHKQTIQILPRNYGASYYIIISILPSIKKESIDHWITCLVKASNNKNIQTVALTGEACNVL